MCWEGPSLRNLAFFITTVARLDHNSSACIESSTYLCTRSLPALLG